MTSSNKFYRIIPTSHPLENPAKPCRGCKFTLTRGLVLWYSAFVKSNTNWNLYKTFVTVYETKNMSRAGGILGISRAAVGQNIKELGNQLGGALFNSHTKGVEPTAAADNLYNNIKGVVDSIYQAEKCFEVFTNKRKETVKIAISNTGAEVLLKEYMNHFLGNSPNIQLEIFKRENMDLYQQKQLDIVIDLKESVNKTDFKTIDLFSLSDAFVATKEFLGKHKIPRTLSLTEILRYPIITKDLAWDLFCKVNNLDVGKYPLAVSMPSYDLLHSIAHNEPNGIVYYCRELSANTNLVVLDITEAIFPPKDFVCGYAKPLSKAARAFIDGFATFVRGNFC